MILHQIIRLVVPFRARVVRTQHRRILHRFVRNTQREAGFRKPVQRFGRVARGLVIVDHVLEADLRRALEQARLEALSDYKASRG